MQKMPSEPESRELQKQLTLPEMETSDKTSDRGSSVESGDQNSVSWHNSPTQSLQNLPARKHNVKTSQYLFSIRQNSSEFSQHLALPSQNIALESQNLPKSSQNSPIANTDFPITSQNSLKSCQYSPKSSHNSTFKSPPTPAVRTKRQNMSDISQNSLTGRKNVALFTSEKLPGPSQSLSIYSQNPKPMEDLASQSGKTVQNGLLNSFAVERYTDDSFLNDSVEPDINKNSFEGSLADKSSSNSCFIGKHDGLNETSCQKLKDANNNEDVSDKNSVKSHEIARSVSTVSKDSYALSEGNSVDSFKV